MDAGRQDTHARYLKRHRALTLLKLRELLTEIVLARIPRLIDGHSGRVDHAALVQRQRCRPHGARLDLADDDSARGSRVIVAADALGDQKVVDAVISQLSLNALFLVKR